MSPDSSSAPSTEHSPNHQISTEATYETPTTAEAAPSMTYRELLAKQSERLNEVPLMFAFSRSSLEAQMKEREVESVDEVVNLGHGGFIARKDIESLHDHMDQSKQELNNLLATDEGMLDALEYELANHEFIITYNRSDALKALDLSMEDERVQRLLPSAVKRYMEYAEA